jgi:NADH:flavin oxidoreductase / NADH oxidase family
MEIAIDRQALARRGKQLEYFTIAWNTLEGLVAVAAGAVAGSISLVGFGIDSFIEVTSGGVLLWRMSVDADVRKRERNEKLSLRIAGVCFSALAAYVGYESISDLAGRKAPEHSIPGIVLACVSLVGSNKRTDEYGGSIENRTRFLSEAVTALISVWGANRVAVRIGPGGTWNGMSDSNPQALFSYVREFLNQFGLAYLHIIEPRVGGSDVVHAGQGAVASEHLRTIIKGKLIAAGGFEPATAEAIVEKGTVDAVAFGRHFVSNPDLPRRIREGLPLSDHDRSTFYTFDANGYTDYPAYESLLVA